MFGEVKYYEVRLGLVRSVRFKFGQNLCQFRLSCAFIRHLFVFCCKFLNFSLQFSNFLTIFVRVYVCNSCSYCRLIDMRLVRLIKHLFGMAARLRKKGALVLNLIIRRLKLLSQY